MPTYTPRLQFRPIKPAPVILSQTLQDSEYLVSSQILYHDFLPWGPTWGMVENPSRGRVSQVGILQAEVGT